MFKRAAKWVVGCAPLFAVLLALVGPIAAASGQAGYNDDRVLIQGFMWESHQEGRLRGEGGFEYEVHWRDRWYAHVKSKAGELADAKFDLIWLPPPSQGEGSGYHPQEYFNFSNNYGTEQQQRDMLLALRAKGIEPIADVVINHRNGSGGWATFKNPDWPAKFICSTDEFWFKQPQDVTAADRPILAAGDKGAPDYMGAGFPNWGGARDLDHSNRDLREGIKTYLTKMKALGYRGWRYDMVKGYAPEYTAEYNFASAPTFAVGEFWDGDARKLSDWVDRTKLIGQPDPAERACSAFDFATYELLKQFINAGNYRALPAITFKDGVYDGLVAVNRDKAVTFLENHDTGFPQKQFDSFQDKAKLMQGYAFILTHSGVPCVYWKHYFDWGLRDKIRPLILARKYAGVHSGSFVKTELHGTDYVAIVGDKAADSSTLIVKIGPGIEFKPDEATWGLETSGEGYAVWVRKTKKQQTQSIVERAKDPIH